MISSVLFTSPAFLVTSLVAIVLYVGVVFLRKSRSLSHLPHAEGDLQNESMGSIMNNAIEKYPGQPFVLPTSPPVVILPDHCVNDVKNRPESEISFDQFINHALYNAQTGLGGAQRSVVGAIRDELTRSIQRTLVEIQDESNHAFETEIGPCHEWTRINLTEKLLRIVALISGRVFVGLPLCRDERWVSASINFTVDAVDGIQAVEKYSSILRPFVAPFLPAMKRLKEHRKWASLAMKPLARTALTDRMENGNIGKKIPLSEEGGGGHEQANFIQWILNHEKDVDKVTPEWLGHEQLSITFAAIHTTTMTATHALLDLAEHPEYIDELRAEMEQVIAEEGHEDGQLRKTSMPKLKKLDSFLRESQRCNPLGLTTMTRMITAPNGYTLPNTNLTIPNGTFTAFSHPYNLERHTSTIPSSLLTRSNEPPLTEFHPFRFSSIRSTIPGEEQKHQFVTTGPEHLGFGHGAKACPGRFFASNEIKIVLVEFLKRYDMSLGEGGRGTREGEVRPKAVCPKGSTAFFPHPDSCIWIKARDKGEKA